MRLTERYEVLKDTITICGEAVSVDLAFDVVLKVLELLSDNALGAWFKLDRALDLLLPFWERSNHSIDVQYEAFVAVFETFIKDSTEYQQGVGEEAGRQEKFMDFTKDAGLLFASFYQAYGIDLFTQQGELHWRKFQVLLLHLPHDSVFKEVVNYRKMKVPSKKEASEDYIKHVREMKRLYHLDDEIEEAIGMDDKLSAYAMQFGGE